MSSPLPPRKGTIPPPERAAMAAPKTMRTAGIPVTPATRTATQETPVQAVKLGIRVHPAVRTEIRALHRR